MGSTSFNRRGRLPRRGRTGSRSWHTRKKRPTSKWWTLPLLIRRLTRHPMPCQRHRSRLAARALSWFDTQPRKRVETLFSPYSRRGCKQRSSDEEKSTRPHGLCGTQLPSPAVALTASQPNPLHGARRPTHPGRDRSRRRRQPRQSRQPRCPRQPRLRIFYAIFRILTLCISFHNFASLFFLKKNRKK